MDNKLLGVKINYVTLDQAVGTVDKWLKKRGKHYIVTPNPEMLVDASFDREFQIALNGSDLAIPDSSRLGWGSFLKSQTNPFLRLFYSPFFLFPSLLGSKVPLFPRLLPRFNYPVTSGIDLMEALLSLSQEKAFTTAYLGGSKRVADKLFKCLRRKYPSLKIVFSSGNMQVNEGGMIQIDNQNNQMTGSKAIKSNNLSHAQFNMHDISQKIDILFVAFGHKKQEKWIYKNLPKLNARVMMGVGGSFDYLSGSVPRAPQFLRKLSLEWVFRLMIQPWRIKRAWKLFYFLYLVLIKK